MQEKEHQEGAKLIEANLKNEETMSLFRILLAIFLPPLAVADKGLSSVIIVLLLTLIGWLPGVIAAFLVLNKK